MNKAKRARRKAAMAAAEAAEEQSKPEEPASTGVTSTTTWGASEPEPEKPAEKPPGILGLFRSGGDTDAP